MIRFWIDAGALGVLVLALLLVVVIDKLMGTGVDPTPAEPQPVVNTLPVVSKELRLAVTESHMEKDGRIWDDMVKLLKHLGEGYKFTVLRDHELHDAKRLGEFDVLFLTCAPPSKQQVVLAKVLKDFVSSGGTVYASDWRFDDIASAFPDIAAKNLAGEGKAQNVEATVVDAGLSDALASKVVPLRFDLDRWKTAAFAGEGVKVLMEGNYQRQQFGVATAPLLVKFQVGKGTVIFTSFHNEAQNSEIEQKLLKYLVFSAATAHIESQVKQRFLGGFSPQKQNLLSASHDNPKATYTYRSTKAGKIRFVLGFDERGATLKMTVVSPSGKKSEKVGTSTFVIEDSGNRPGDWQYTVEAVSVPFPDFPFTVTVAESDEK